MPGPGTTGPGTPRPGGCGPSARSRRSSGRSTHWWSAPASPRLAAATSSQPTAAARTLCGGPHSSSTSRRQLWCTRYQAKDQCPSRRITPQPRKPGLPGRRVSRTAAAATSSANSGATSACEPLYGLYQRESGTAADQGISAACHSSTAPAAPPRPTGGRSPRRTATAATAPSRNCGVRARGR
ncbi:hypothetical protein GXW82_24030 [Streptacidiphilus sp. 4-A2]|nr:hypothetical protein [Streptacidiphilus sp. 4-A2]